MKTFFHWLAVLLALSLAALPGSAAPAYAGEIPPNHGGLRLLGGGVAPLLYQFSGVVDTGSISAPGTAVTSITCTNWSAATPTVNIIVYGFDAMNTAYSIVVDAWPAWRTYTFSTHYTALYFENYVFAANLGDAGTGTINQGTGKVFSASRTLICSAQVLDPMNNPPTFMTRLTLHDANGMIARNVKHGFLPSISR